MTRIASTTADQAAMSAEELDRGIRIIEDLAIMARSHATREEEWLALKAIELLRGAHAPGTRLRDLRDALVERLNTLDRPSATAAVERLLRPRLPRVWRRPTRGGRRRVTLLSLAAHSFAGTYRSPLLAALGAAGYVPTDVAQVDQMLAWLPRQPWLSACDRVLAARYLRTAAEVIFHPLERRIPDGVVSNGAFPRDWRWPNRVLALLARANQARADHNAALFADTYEFALADAGELVRLARAGGPIAETVLQALGYVGTSPNAIWPARSLKTSLLITVIAAAVLAAAVMRADLHGRYVRAVATYSLSQYAAGELWSVGTGGPR